MANPIPVQLVISGDTSNLSARLAEIQRQMQSINGGAGGAGGAGGGGGMFDSGTKSADTFQQSLRGLIGRFSALWAVMKSSEGIANVFAVGIKFNATMQDARLGIGALITAQAKLTDGSGNQLNAQQSLNAAMALGDDQIQKLRISGLQTAATTEQLVSAYQDAVGGGLRAGMSLDQIRKLTVQTVQAAGAMGVPMNQLNQEIRSILDGTIDRNSRVAIRLGITNADVEKWKSAGTLFENLNVKMAAFSEAGKESMKNWTVLLSNMAEANQILLGEAFKNPMANIQDALSRVMETIVNINTAQISDKIAPVVMMLKDIGNVLGDFAVGTINAVSAAIMSMGDWWAKNRDALTGVIASFKVFMSDALSFVGGAAAGLLKTLADGFIWFTKLPEAIKLTSISIGVFVIAVWSANTALATTAAAGIASLVASLGNLALAVRVATMDMAGLSIAIQALGGPIAWVIAAIAAVSVGVYYWSTRSERAAQTQLELARTATETTTALVRMGPALKDIDERMKNSKLNELEKVQRDQDAKAAIEELVKLAPSQRSIIEQQISDGMKYNDVLKRQLELRLSILSAQIAEKAEELRQKQAEAVKNSTDPGMLRKAAWFLAGQPWMAYTSGAAAGAEEYATLLKTQELRMAEYTTIANKLELEEAMTKLTPNKAEDAKKLAAIEKVRAANEQLRMMVLDSEMDAMAKLTLEQQRQWEWSRADLELQRKLEQINKSKASPAAKREAVDSITAADENRRDAINEKYDAKRRAGEQAFDDFVERQQGDMLTRRLAALDQEYREKLRLSGRVVSEEQQAADMAERRARETTAFRQAEVKSLEAALVDLEKTKGRALTFDEQISGLYNLAAALDKSSEAVEMLKKKLDAKEARKDSWFEGMKAGLLDVTNTMEDRFTVMRKLVKSMADGLRNAFSTAITGMLNGSMSLSQGLKSIWKGITDTIIKSVADMIAQFLVAQAAQLIFAGVTKVAAGAGAIAAMELAIMESWAAYAGIPFIGAGLAMAQIGMITATYAGLKAMSIGNASAGGGAAAASEGMNYAGYATGGLITKPGFIAENPYSRELVAPESTFLDWIKNIGTPALSAPMGNYRNASGGELAFAGGGGSVNASFDGALIIGDSAEGLRKAAGALRVIRTYDNRVNG